MSKAGESQADDLLVEDLPEIVGNNLEVELEDREEARTNFLNSKHLQQIRARPSLDQLKNGPNLTVDDSGKIKQMSTTFSDYLKGMGTFILLIYKTRAILTHSYLYD